MLNLRKQQAIALMLTITLTVFALTLPKPAKAEKIYNIHFPVYFIDFNPCANNGTGEEIEFSGDIHVRWSITVDSDGGFHGSVTENYQGVGGVGLTTGTRYRSTAAVSETFNGKVGENYTLVVGIRYVGQGRGNNFVTTIKQHYTVNANGEVTTFIDDSSIECR